MGGVEGCWCFMRENYRWADSPSPPPPDSPETLSRRSWLPVDSVGKTEEAREKCECVERAGTKRPKRFFFFSRKRERERKKSQRRGSKYVFARMWAA